MRAATVSAVSTSGVERSSTPSMIVLPRRSCSTEQSSDGCAVSTDTWLTEVPFSSDRKS
jgi:hypothetical protein